MGFRVANQRGYRRGLRQGLQRQRQIDLLLGQCHRAVHAKEGQRRELRLDRFDGGYQAATWFDLVQCFEGGGDQRDEDNGGGVCEGQD